MQATQQVGSEKSPGREREATPPELGTLLRFLPPYHLPSAENKQKKERQVATRQIRCRHQM
jgi:hypothetical protein